MPQVRPAVHQRQAESQLIMRQGHLHELSHRINRSLRVMQALRVRGSLAADVPRLEELERNDERAGGPVDQLVTQKCPMCSRASKKTRDAST
jgi:hypothetical protein